MTDNRPTQPPGLADAHAAEHAARLSRDAQYTRERSTRASAGVLRAIALAWDSSRTNDAAEVRE